MDIKKIAFVTSTLSPEISSDDTILAKVLKEHAITCVAAPWDDPTVDWMTFDFLLIRSCWNYHLVPEKFTAWLNLIRKRKIKMFNPADLILWNMNKHYLKELQNKGITIPDTVWISEHDFYVDKFAEILDEKKWNRAVLKPCISASSFRTSVITPITAKAEGKLLLKNSLKGGMMIQEFVEAIPQYGELSLLFFNGNFSHAVIKQASPGDFRVQHEFGGKSRLTFVEKKILNAAEKVIDKLSITPLYARVDGVLTDDHFCLMELELIEPVLFFNHAEDAATQFVRQMLNSL